MMILRSIVKYGLGAAFRRMPALHAAMQRGVTCFVYHEVNDHPSAFARDYGLAISKQGFDAQVRWIKQNFNIIRPSAILEAAPLPDNAALISFDDGFEGAFLNGVDVLERHDVPSINFLNMDPLRAGRPMVSALCLYLWKTSKAFRDFAANRDIGPPIHLHATPGLIDGFTASGGEIAWDEALEFQGKMADMSLLRSFETHPLVEYGNHLFDHWNAAALSDDEFLFHFQSNQREIDAFSNGTRLFAFTNGHPGSCFLQHHVDLLESQGAGRAFSAVSGLTADRGAFLLGRLAPNDTDVSDNHMWCRLGRAMRG